MRDFLLADPKLELVSIDDASASSNYIFTLELMPPPKAEALAWLDRGSSSNAPRPARKAIAVVFLMNNSHYGSRLMQIEVGDLPTPSYWKDLVYPKQRHPISIHSRPGSAPEYAVVETILQVQGERGGGSGSDRFHSLCSIRFPLLGTSPFLEGRDA